MDLAQGILLYGENDFSPLCELDHFMAHDETIYIQPLAHPERKRACSLQLNGFLFDAFALSQKDIKNYINQNRPYYLFNAPNMAGRYGLYIELSPSLINGRRSPTIMDNFLQLGLILSQYRKINGIVWTPSQNALSFQQFNEQLNASRNGEMTLLILFTRVNQSKFFFRTTGLQYFANQEINLESDETIHPSDAVKIIMRIAHDMMTNGRIENDLTAHGLRPTQRIKINAVKENPYVDVRIYTKIN